ncbi:MAG: hypothetical protein OK456_00365 [Thaumarchaeota archaeon]|nr:hypothetical protein [Nitrososphaerota archaeon]
MDRGGRRKMTWLRDRKLVLARRARKGDANYIHAQLLLSGQKVVRDEIEGRSHRYYFDCGCVRSYSLSVEFSASESVSACRKHKGLAGGAL